MIYEGNGIKPSLAILMANAAYISYRKRSAWPNPSFLCGAQKRVILLTGFPAVKTAR
jgi:hypothetical protein